MTFNCETHYCIVVSKHEDFGFVYAEDESNMFRLDMDEFEDGVLPEIDDLVDVELIGMKFRATVIERAGKLDWKEYGF